MAEITQINKMKREIYQKKNGCQYAAILGLGLSLSSFTVEDKTNYNLTY
jgi:hypothetical protein